MTRPRRVLATTGLLAALALSVLAGPVLAGPANAASASTGEPSSAKAPAAGASGRSPVPLLAFYYSWFDKNSWNRAKIDYPQLGRYTSDDPAVMRQHILWAKAAGIDGFIVSWKDTPTNDRRLSLLMQVARAEHFKLAMIYQGLDFGRHPLPADRVAADFKYFETTYASDPVFLQLNGKAFTVWSGTWAYSLADVTRVVTPVRDKLLVLNTEKNLAGYKRLSSVTDGDAYYWSSVNPETNPNYGPKLDEMARAIHADGNYWMAPFAPGFDARKVGGTQTVDRANGDTLRKEYQIAVSSSPDLLGLISWNEFSENSYVEPSQRYGHLFLNVLADLRNAHTPVPAAAIDSSEPSGSGGSGPFPWDRNISGETWMLIGVVIAFLAGVAALRPVVRNRDAKMGLMNPPTALPALPALPPTMGLRLPSAQPSLTASWWGDDVLQPTAPPPASETRTPQAEQSDDGPQLDSSDQTGSQGSALAP